MNRRNAIIVTAISTLTTSAAFSQTRATGPESTLATTGRVVLVGSELTSSEVNALARSQPRAIGATIIRVPGRAFLPLDTTLAPSERANPRVQ